MLAELEPRAQEFKKNRAEYNAFLQMLDAEQWTTLIGSEGYSPRQTLAHMSGADKSMLRMAQNWMADKETVIRPDFDLNFFNARQQEKRANMTNDALVQEWHTAQDDVIQFMETVGEADLIKRGDHPRVGNINLGYLFLVITTHEANHIEAVTKTL